MSQRTLKMIQEEIKELSPVFGFVSEDQQFLLLDIAESQLEVVREELEERLRKTSIPYQIKTTREDIHFWSERQARLVHLRLSADKSSERQWLEEELSEGNRVLAKLKRRLLFLSSPDVQDRRRDFRALIDIAREFPIGDLLPNSGRVRAHEGRTFFPCPLHREMRPSFVWYERDNRYYCFGCNEHGDVIDLYMKLNNEDFRSAVLRLSRTS